MYPAPSHMAPLAALIQTLRPLSLFSRARAPMQILPSPDLSLPTQYLWRRTGAQCEASRVTSKSGSLRCWPPFGSSSFRQFQLSKRERSNLVRRLKVALSCSGMTLCRSELILGVKTPRGHLDWVAGGGHRAIIGSAYRDFASRTDEPSRPVAVPMAAALRFQKRDSLTVLLPKN